MRFRHLLSAAVCAAALLAFGSAQATVLWQSDFVNKGIEQFDIFDVGPDVNPEFEPRSGPSRWSVRNGALTQSSNIYGVPDPTSPSTNDTNGYTGTHAVVKDLTAQDGIFFFQFRTADNDGIGLVFRFQDKKNFMRFYSMPDVGNGGPLTRIEKWTDGVWEVLAKVEDPSLVYQQNVMETMLVVAQGNEIRAYLGDLNEPVLTAEDPDPKPGRFGMSLYASEGFDATRFQALSPDSSLYIANVQDSDGNPQPGLFVRMAREGSTVSSIFTNPGGQALFADLTPGEYEISTGGLTVEPVAPQKATVRAGISSEDITLNARPTALVADLSTEAGASWKLKLPATAAEDFRDPAASEAGFDDYDVPSDWSNIDPTDNIYGWLRVQVSIPAEHQGKDLALTGWNFDDQDWTYWNGQFLGRDVVYDRLRTYVIPGSQVMASNVLAIRGFDGTGGGGITNAAPVLRLANPSVAVSGWVRDLDGQPIADAEVSVFAADTPWGPQGATALTGDDGVYRVSGLAPGSYTVTRLPRFDLSPDEGETQSFTLAAGQTAEANFSAEKRPTQSLATGPQTTWLALYGVETSDPGPAQTTGVDESEWTEVTVPDTLEIQGLGEDRSFFWYRTHITLSDAIKAFEGRDLILTGFNVDDADVTYFNGQEIGKTGTLPTDPADPDNTGYNGNAGGIRTYTIPSSLVNWSGDNVLTILGYEATGDSGITVSAPLLVVAPGAGPAPVKGDANGNGRLEITDVIAVLRHVAGLTPLTGDGLTAADVDGRAGVSVTDAVAMLRAVAGLAPLP